MYLFFINDSLGHIKNENNSIFYKSLDLIRHHIEMKFCIVEKTVIIVDDNKEIIEAISELLTHHSI